MSNLQNDIIAEHIHEDNCEDDCTRLCTGCDKTFCQIKEDHDLPHNEELKDICWWGDDVYCSQHCYPR